MIKNLYGIVMNENRLQLMNCKRSELLKSQTKHLYKNIKIAQYFGFYKILQNGTTLITKRTSIEIYSCFLHQTFYETGILKDFKMFFTIEPSTIRLVKENVTGHSFFRAEKTYERTYIFINFISYVTVYNFCIVCWVMKTLDSQE